MGGYFALMNQRPMYEMLDRASKRVSLHMPGMQGESPFEPMDAYRLDTTEIPETDDLYAPTGAIATAEMLMAKCAGASQTLLMTGGSTAGMHTMIRYALRRGETMILPRNVHISAMHACANFGVKVHFAKPTMDDGLVHTALDSYRQAMQECKEAKALLVVRPDYYGMMLPKEEMETLCKEAHENGMLVLVDEAHGAHLNWCKERQTAMACGADISTQSAHKTLPALTGAAWLHASASVEAHRLRQMLRMVQTSSPSFVILLSLDDARAWMEQNGQQAMQGLKAKLAQVTKECKSLGYERLITGDPFRLVLEAKEGGFCLMASLAQKGIDVEMADERRIVCILSLLGGEKALDRLLEALKTFSNEEKQFVNEHVLPPIPKRRMALCMALFETGQSVPLEEAIGRISAMQVGLYPPGVALITAGEEITKELVDYLQAIPPARCFGLLDGGKALYCVKENKHESISF